jgi:hypothetical protein
LTTGRVSSRCACNPVFGIAAQIVGAETLDTDGFGGGFNHAPDRSIAQFLPHDTPFIGNRTEQSFRTMPGGSRPSVHQELDPQGNGYSANAITFAGQIGDHPEAPALLNILFGERGQFDPAQSAARPCLA